MGAWKIMSGFKSLQRGAGVENILFKPKPPLWCPNSFLWLEYAFLTTNPSWGKWKLGGQPPQRPETHSKGLFVSADGLTLRQWLADCGL